MGEPSLGLGYGGGRLTGADADRLTCDPSAMPCSHQEDLEAGPRPGPGPSFTEEDPEVALPDPFDIADTKNASHETLRRWRVIEHNYMLTTFVHR